MSKMFHDPHKIPQALLLHTQCTVPKITHQNFSVTLITEIYQPTVGYWS